MKTAFVIGLLGAESTGKTSLSEQLRDALEADGHAVATVSEYLREFCVLAGRVPRIDEQAPIAAEQTRRIAATAATHDVVVADTTALMVAVYSELVFGDRSLYDTALRDHARCQLTLLMAIDLPWVADPLVREGPHVQQPVDQLVRAALQRSGMDYAVVMGSGQQRVAAALDAVRRSMQVTRDGIDRGARWQWQCEHCGDPDCERQALRLARAV